MCDCIDIDMGSYDNQMWVPAPEHMPKANGYCLDRCIAEEVMLLWRLGITTTGCCCGHNKTNGYIGVIDADIPRMKELGYEVAPNPVRPGDEDSVYPRGPFAKGGVVKATEPRLMGEAFRGYPPNLATH